MRHVIPPAFQYDPDRETTKIGGHTHNTKNQLYILPNRETITAAAEAASAADREAATGWSAAQSVEVHAPADQGQRIAAARAPGASAPGPVWADVVPCAAAASASPESRRRSNPVAPERLA